MGKSYINNAVIGNGSMLGCITETGELIRLYWPDIDFAQHVEKMLTGFFDTRFSNSTLWFSEGDHQYAQRYLDDTNILETTALLTKLPLKVIQTDFCLPDESVMIRHYEIINVGSEEVHVGMGVASHVISSQHDMGSTLFDFQLDALMHYRHGGYWVVGSSLEVKEFQIGNNPFGAVWEGKLVGPDSIGMSPDGAMLWDVGILPPGCGKTITLYIAFAKGMNDVKALMRRIKATDYNTLVDTTRIYWHNYLKSCRTVISGNENADSVYRRSLLLFKLMINNSTGGILASPEIDEGFTQCGRYAYCWGRDAAFITQAFDEVGLFQDTARFYEWASRVQDTEGFWHQRYHMNGRLAPSWGIQIDETGSILFGILRHFEATKNMRFLKEMWPAVVEAVGFLENFIDTETNLPKPSFDLWEERKGEHTYSTAAVVAGINAASQIGELLGIADETTRNWRKIAREIKDAMIKELVDHQNGVFFRSIRTKLNPWGKEPSEQVVTIRVNSKGFAWEVSQTDARMDISLLGTSVPFRVFPPDDSIVRKTAAKIEDVLVCEKVGGIRRYEDDSYAGGNPWVIATLWMALYHLETGELNKAAEYLEWSIKSRTHLDLLPEQADRQDGKPCWVIPLTWSHAMYVLALKGLLDKGGQIFG
ncbi:MAG: glycoside hydrolase [Clostridiaceae bacterium]|nr:glycoside hydrolase [Clostridiaceae bacterium]